MRDLFVVICRILYVLNDYNEFLELKNNLKSILERIQYKAPEVILKENWWKLTEAMLVNTFVPMQQSIDYKVMSIWTMREYKNIGKGEDY